MKFVTLADLAHTIRSNFHKVPHNIDFVMGIPRSGVLAASIIAEFLNAPLIDLNSFVAGANPSGGNRVRFHRGTGLAKQRVLVVDDTIFHGRSMRGAREKLQPFANRFDFSYMVVYQEGPCMDIDLSLEDLRRYTESFSSFVIYEWNIFHHIPAFMDKCIWDIDGVMCVEPPDERTGQPYIDYISQATPLFTPTVPVGEIVTYRLSIYRKQTEKWLKENGIEYNVLKMFHAESWEERAKWALEPARYKANIYSEATWAKLFVESSDRQAREIYRITGKPVYSVEGNILYSK